MGAVCARMRTAVNSQLCIVALRAIRQGMNAQIIVAGIEAVARRRNLRITEVCAMAGVDRATWQRWKSGKFKPSLDKYLAITKLHSDLLDTEEP